MHVEDYQVTTRTGVRFPAAPPKNAKYYYLAFFV